MKLLFTKTLSVIFAVILSVFMITFKPADVYAAEYTLTDYKTDISWSVQVAESSVHIASSHLRVNIPVDSPVTFCSVYNGVFTFLSYTEHNEDFAAMYYTYDTKTGKLTSTPTTLLIFTDETRFAVDSQGYFYLVDRSDNHLINCFYNGSMIYSAEIKSTVYQLLCTDGIHITAVTADGIYVINNLEVSLVSGARPVTPCAYTGKGIICDAQGVEFNYDNGGIYQIIEETTATDPLTPDNSAEIIINGNYIIPQYGTTVAKLRKFLNASKDDFVVYKTDGSIYSQGKLGTGMTVVYSDRTYDIIIYGELTGEGNINSRDLKLMMKFLTGEETPDTLQLLSADTNQDGKLCTKDLLALSKLY